MTEIFELRQYTLHPDTRDVLIELFEREFIETQEETGMRVVGQFRDLDDPDRFVWIRPFPDMVARNEALTTFTERAGVEDVPRRANATMITWDFPQAGDRSVAGRVHHRRAGTGLPRHQVDSQGHGAKWRKRR